MGTKDRILAEALRQFNDLGVAKVTIRSIASELQISAGHLAYHYKNIETLIEALYLSLVSRIDEQLQAQLASAVLDLESLLVQTKNTLRLLDEYRFILIDFPHIGRSVPSIQLHFQTLVRTRQQQFQVIIAYAIGAGLLRQERLAGEYDRLIYNTIMLSNAWPSDAEIHFSAAARATVIDFYFKQIASLIVPYLTAKGLEAYEAYFGLKEE